MALAFYVNLFETFLCTYLTLVVCYIVTVIAAYQAKAKLDSPNNDAYSASHDIISLISYTHHPFFICGFVCATLAGHRYIVHVHKIIYMAKWINYCGEKFPDLPQKGVSTAGS